MKNLAFAALLLVLIGCQSGGAPSGTATAQKPRVKIGVSVPSADHGWTAGVIWWAKKAMAKHPEVDWVFKDAHNPSEQISDIETMMAQHVQGLVVLAYESAALTPTAKKVHQAGIYLVNVDRGFTEPVADLYLQGDNKQFGKISGELVVKQLGGKGKLLVLQGIPCTVDSDRVNAANEVFKANPGIQVLASQEADWNRQKAFEVTQTLLTKYPQVDAIWAQDDDMALGAEKAVQEAARKDVKWILGGAGMKDIVKRVMDGDPMYPGDVTYPPSMISDGIDDAAKGIGKSTGSQTKVVIPVELVTRENAKQFYFPDSVY